MSESSALVEHKEDLPTREAKKSTDSEFDRIYKYFHSKSRIELTPGEQQVMERWEKAWFLLLRNRTRNQVAQILCKLYNVSRSTAYDDVRNAMNLFSDPREDMRAAKRAIAEDNLLKGAERAWKNGNLDMHLKYMDKYAEINGLKEPGGDSSLEELIKKFKPQQIIMNFRAEDLQAEAERMRTFFEDTNFEVVP
jgi:hypothetical protein